MSLAWNHPEGLRVLVCRPGLAMDTADVLALTRTIWEGHDYVPQIWSTWLIDSDGLLAVAQLGSHVVGLVKLSYLSPGEWWMEGLRVDPAYEGQRIASHLHEYVIDFWQRQGDGVVRLTTYRPAVIHLCERTGFHTLRRIQHLQRFPPSGRRACFPACAARRDRRRPGIREGE